MGTYLLKELQQSQTQEKITHNANKKVIIKNCA